MSQPAASAELVVLSTISAKEALIELVPEFEHATGHKVNITYAGGSGLADQIAPPSNIGPPADAQFPLGTAHLGFLLIFSDLSVHTSCTRCLLTV